jgi:pimeloyl-ACP methyl ester carboxylesterase
LAIAGFTVLRFDFSGIGESEKRNDALPRQEHTICEAKAAMDLLAANYGVENFLLLGICSGADDAFRVALVDNRVVGALLVEPFMFRSRGFALDSIKGKLLHPAYWMRLMRRAAEAAWSRLLSCHRPRTSSTPLEDESHAWVMPQPERIVEDLHTLASQGVALLLVYAPPGPAEYNYRTILEPEVKALGLDALIRMHTFTGSNHTLSPLHHQAQLAEMAVEWGLAVASRRSKGCLHR